MGSFNSKAAIKRNQMPLDLPQIKNHQKHLNEEGILAANEEINWDQPERTGVQTQSSGRIDECAAKRSQNRATSSGKSASNLPQYKWLVSCPVERDEAHKVSYAGIKCSYPGLQHSLRGDKAKNEFKSQISQISSNTRARKGTKISSNHCSTQDVESDETPSRNETRIRQPNDSLSGGVSAMSDKTPVNVSGSVGFGVLMSDSNLGNFHRCHRSRCPNSQYENMR